MPQIERWIIDKVLDATSIVDVIGEFVDLRKAGVNYTGCCPFHEDHHDGNFIVRPEGLKTGGGTYRCFVCDAKGGVVQFLMQHEKMTFPDAIRWLGKKYNIDVDDAPINFTPPPPRPMPVPLPTLEIPREIVKKTMCYTQRDRFCNWLRHLPWGTKEERGRIEQVLWMYCVGRWYDERVVFCQIDENGVVRSGKLSEKTALICAIHFGDFDRPSILTSSNKTCRNKMVIKQTQQTSFFVLCRKNDKEI